MNEKASAQPVTDNNVTQVPNTKSQDKTVKPLKAKPALEKYQTKAKYDKNTELIPYFIGRDSESKALKHYQYIADIDGFMEVSSTMGGFKSYQEYVSSSDLEEIIFFNKPSNTLGKQKSYHGKQYSLKKGFFGKCSFQSRIVADTIQITNKGGSNLTISYNRTFLEGVLNSLNDNSNIAHSSIRLLYLIVLSGFEDLLEKALKQFGYKHWLYPDDLNPIQLALHINSRGMLDAFANYLEDIDSIGMTPNIISEGIACSSKKFNLLVIDKFMSYGRSTIKLPLQLPQIQDPFCIHFKNDSFSKGFSIENKVSRLRKDYTGYDMMEADYLTTSIKNDYSVGSQLVIDIFESLTEADEDVVTSKIKGMIFALWNENRSKILVLSMIYWIFAICMIFNLVFCSDIEGDECKRFFNFITDQLDGDQDWIIIIFMICFRVLCIGCYALLIMYELVVLSSKRLAHLKELDNIIDWVIYIGAIPLIVGFFVPSSADEERIPNFLICLYILFVGIRFLLYMRIFNGMRYLIKMLTQVFLDIKDFGIVLIIAIFVLASIEMESTRVPLAGGDYRPHASIFLKVIDQVYDNGYGNFSDEKGASEWNVYFFFLIQSILFALVMFNFLIAIISKTYENVSEKEEYYSLLELLAILVDYGHFSSAFFLCRGKNRGNYLHVVVQKDTETGKI